jgi:uncharacterized membrane protein SpoIIM required for sporulation
MLPYFLVIPQVVMEIKTLIVYGVLGFIFLSSGISLVRTTKDES